MEKKKHQPNRWRLPPFLGKTHMNMRDMKALASARLDRWKEIQFDGDELKAAIAYELACWLTAGYPIESIMIAWRAQPRHWHLASKIRAALQDWRKAHLPKHE